MNLQISELKQNKDTLLQDTNPWYNFAMVKSRKNIENIFSQDTSSLDRLWRLKLDENENIYGISNVVLSSIKNMDFSDISKNISQNKLIKKLSTYYKRDENNFLLTNGIEEAIRIIIDSYIDENEKIYSYKPINYSILKYSQIRNIEFQENENDSKIIFIETPNSITGKLIRASEIEITVQKHLNSLFVIDCSYINFSQNVAFEDYLDLVEKFDNVIILKSFSFDYALFGLNLNLIYSRKEIIENLKKISESVNCIALKAGYSAYNDDKYYENIKNLNINARNLLFEGLKEKGFEPYESEANFILCDFSYYVDFYYQKFKNNGVIVKKFSELSEYKNCLRITVPKIGSVKYILALLKKKDVLIFDIDKLFDLQISFDDGLIQKFDTISNSFDVVLCTNKTKEEIKSFLYNLKIDNLFNYTILMHSKKANDNILRYIPYETIKFVSYDVEGVIYANNINIETIGIVDFDSNKSDKINNFKHLGVKHILQNIEFLEEFLNENEQNENDFV